MCSSDLGSSSATSLSGAAELEALGAGPSVIVTQPQAVKDVTRNKVQSKTANGFIFGYPLSVDALRGKTLIITTLC